MDILYRDAHIVVVIKPVGMLSQQGDESCVPDEISQQLKVDNVWPVHRLDKMVGGVMVYALSNKAAGALSRAVQEQKLEKTYFAVLSAAPEKEDDILTDLLFHDKSKNKTYVVKRMRKGVKEARLRYHTMEQQQGKTLVHVHLYTGRTHQIRVQFSSRKLPLIGDGRYGEKTKQTQIALWSYSLRFKHPVTSKEMYFAQRPPRHGAWSEFQDSSFCPENG